MMREIANPTMLHDGSGWGALVGMSSAILAERGFTGAPAITIEEDRAAPYWQDLGTFWQMEHQYVKPYPICRWAHAAIDGLRTVMNTHGLTHDQIAHVDIHTFHEACQLFSAVPQTTSQAQYSLPFAVAVQAVHGRIGVEHLTGSGLADPDVARFMSRISVRTCDRHSARFPAGRWADVSVTTRDGRLLHSGDTHARGGPEAPMSRQDVIDKFLEFARPQIGGVAKTLAGAVLDLVEPDARFDRVASFLYPGLDR